MTPPEQGGPVNSLPGFILVVALTVGAFWIGEIPLPTDRPPADEFVPDRYEEIQQYDTRLWQDPFDAIKKAESAGADGQHFSAWLKAAPDLGSAPDQPTLPCAPGCPQKMDLCSNFAQKEMQQQSAAVNVIAVLVPGEPYAEDVENRRRIRYAVVSGLARSGYTPYNSQHVGLATASLDKIGVPVPLHVPFEWFKPHIKGQSPLLLLWINEAPTRKRALHAIQEVITETCGCPAKPEVVVLGPTDSDTLHEMLQEVGEFGKGEQLPFNLRIYSPRATAEDEQLLQGLNLDLDTGEPYKEIAKYLKANGLDDRIAFQRTIATDRVLAKALVKELSLRGVNPGDGVVLVSEWDTLYGRSLPQSFIEEMLNSDERALTSSDRPATPDNGMVCSDLSICRFSYLRGLDGMLPGQNMERQDVAGEKDKDKGKGKGKVSIEPAFGNQRVDYLRRIALRIADLDQELKDQEFKDHKKQDGVKAIGILGSDVYDKLLILRALRPRFPEAIFFTTDLDARLLHPNERAVARNLVVAAGYGLRLTGWLQRDIPDFRDSYQSAYFLSVQLALLHSDDGYPDVVQKLRDWNTQPRIFEIGRTRPVDLSSTKENLENCEVNTCSSPHPGRHAHTVVVWYSFVPLVLLLLFWYSLNSAAVAAFLHEARKGIGKSLRLPPGPWYLQVRHLLIDRWLWGVFLALLFAGMLIWELYLIGWNILFADPANGEPFSWFEGVSIWPSVMLRALAGLLALYFLLHCMHLLRKNDKILTRQFFVEQEKIILNPDRPSMGKRFWYCLVRTHFYRVCLACLFPRRLTDIKHHNGKAVIFWRDAVRPYTRTALIGRMLLTLMLLLGFLLPLLAMLPSEPPNTPFRGIGSYDINKQMIVFAVLSFLLLLVFAIDTTRRTARLVSALGVALGGCAIWPDNAIQKTGCADTGVHYCEEWLNIQLIAARTDVVGRFIYYPFIVLSLIIVSRSPIIDNWQISPILAMIFTFYLGVLIVCTMLLRNAAETARRNMQRSLTLKIIEARGNNDPEHRIRHMEGMRDDIKNERRGTFSSYLDQPWLKALLLPIGSYSGLQLLEYLSYLNL